MKKIFPILTILIALALIVCHRSEVGWISIQSTPEGAAVYLDDSLTGDVTNCVFEVVVGEHHLKLTLEGCEDWDTLINLGTDQTIYLNTVFNFIKGAFKWKYPVGFAVFSSPSIGNDGTIYIGSLENDLTGYLYAINPNGTLKWRFKTNSYNRSSPAIASDGTIYLGSEDTYLYAVNPDGSLKWKYPTETNIYSSPAIGVDGTIYLEVGAHINAIDRYGSLKWKLPIAGGIAVSSPALSWDGFLYVAVNYAYGNSYIYSFNTDDTLADSLRFQWVYVIQEDITSSPAIGADGSIYFGSDDPYGINGCLYALTPDGSLRWKYLTGSSVSSSPAIGSDGTIYFGSYDSYLYALNPDGSLQWRFKTDGEITSSSPAIGSNGVIYVGSYGNYVYAIKPDGSLEWEFETGDRVISSPAIGSDGTVYIGSYDGHLYAIACSSSGLTNSPWPKYRHDNQNTGNAAWPIH